MKHLYTILFLFLNLTAFAQTGCFKAFDSQNREVQVFCVGQPIRFEDCTGRVTPDKEYYDFEYKKSSGIPTNLSNTVKTHTYNTPGTYQVLQIANTGNPAAPTDTLTRVFEVKATPAPTFTAESCGGNQVLITITDQNYDRYTLKFSDGGTAELNAGGTYTHLNRGTGTLSVEVIGNYTAGNCTGTATQTLTMLPAPTTPYIRELQVLQEAVTGELQFTIDNLQTEYSYVIERFLGGGSPFEVIQNIQPVTPGTGTFRVTGVNTTTVSIYRVRVVDNCGNSLVNSDPMSSTILEAVQGNEQTDINWRITPGFAQSYDLFRNGAVITAGITPTTFTDTDITCGQEYCYYVRSKAQDGVAVSISAPKCVTATSVTAPPAGTLFATFKTNNEVELTLQTQNGQTIKQVVYERSIAGSPYQSIATKPQLQHTDRVIMNVPICYRAISSNSCELKSDPTPPACPILLSAAQPDDASITFIWTNYGSVTDGVSAYILELLDEKNQVIASTPIAGNTHSATNLNPDQEVLRYRVRATLNSGADTYSNIVMIEQQVRLYVPSAFTPNGDGLNDIFEVKGATFNTFSMKIYHRSGNLIFSSTDISVGWDGTYNGQLMPAGAYVYEIDINLTNGSSKRRRGTITLLR